MSVATHSNHVFLPLPFHMTPSTSKFLHLETQSIAVLRSTCPYHLSLPRLTTLFTLSLPNPCLSFSHDLLMMLILIVIQFILIMLFMQGRLNIFKRPRHKHQIALLLLKLEIESVALSANSKINKW